LIETLVETRAKGGNLLLNIGPRPDGSIPTPQEDRVRELGLWNFVNRDAVFDVRPCPRIREGGVWFTREAREEPTTVYAFVTGARWERHTGRQTLTFESIRATSDTEIEILGQSGEVFEYRSDVHPKGDWEQGEDGLQVWVTRAQRLYNADTYSDASETVRWSNPPVIRITNARTVQRS
jgi:alpha-L-fucosidase